MCLPVGSAHLKQLVFVVAGISAPVCTQPDFSRSIGTRDKVTFGARKPDRGPFLSCLHSPAKALPACHFDSFSRFSDYVLMRSLITPILAILTGTTPK